MKHVNLQPPFTLILYRPCHLTHAIQISLVETHGCERDFNQNSLWQAAAGPHWCGRYSSCGSFGIWQQLLHYSDDCDFRSILLSVQYCCSALVNAIRQAWQIWPTSACCPLQQHWSLTLQWRNTATWKTWAIVVLPVYPGVPNAVFGKLWFSFIE